MKLGGVATATAVSLPNVAGAADSDSTSDGELIWATKTDGSVHSSPTVVQGSVYFVGGSSLTAVDAESGGILWEFDSSGGEIESSPNVVDGVAYFCAQPGLHAVDTDSGEEIWSYDVEESSVRCSPTVADGTVYFGDAEESLYALDAGSGELEWELENVTSGNTTPVVVDDTVYIGTVRAIDANSQETLWEFEPERLASSELTVADGVLYATVSPAGLNASPSLYALDTEFGEVLWEKDVGSSTPPPVGSSMPTVADGTVYVGSREGSLYALDAKSGEIDWEYEFRPSVMDQFGKFSSPTVADGTVYVCAGISRPEEEGPDGGFLLAVDDESGELEWVFDTIPISSSPIVVDGVVYFGDFSTLFTREDDTRIYAVDAGVSGSSEDSRVELGTLNHHDSWAQKQSVGIDLGDESEDENERGETTGGNTTDENVSEQNDEDMSLSPVAPLAAILSCGYLYGRYSGDGSKED